MKKLELKEIVMSLVGNINPIGETNTDNDRFENLKNLCELVDDLVGKIDDVSYKNKGSREFSVKRASDYANKFLTDNLGIKE